MKKKKPDTSSFFTIKPKTVICSGCGNELVVGEAFIERDVPGRPDVKQFGFFCRVKCKKFYPGGYWNEEIKRLMRELHVHANRMNLPGSSEETLRDMTEAALRYQTAFADLQVEMSEGRLEQTA